MYDPPPPYSATAPQLPMHAPMGQPQPTAVLMPQPPPLMYPTQPSGAVPVTATARGAGVVVVVQGTLGPYSTQVTCPKCKATVMTSTRSECGLLTFLSAGLCMVFGGVFGCCLIPFCVRSCQDIEHRCPNCKHYIGIYRRL